MIEFRGELSEKCKAVYLKRLQKLNAILSISTGIITDIPFVLIGYFLMETLREVSYVLFCVAVCWLLIMILNSIPFINSQEKALEGNIPECVTIKDGKVKKEGRGRGNYGIREIKNVKKVIDEGEWYQIIFYFPYKLAECICQKDLIVEGTIEEFEELFQDYIVRRIKEK